MMDKRTLKALAVALTKRSDATVITQLAAVTAQELDAILELAKTEKQLAKAEATLASLDELGKAKLIAACALERKASQKKAAWYRIERPLYGDPGYVKCSVADMLIKHYGKPEMGDRGQLEWRGTTAKKAKKVTKYCYRLILHMGPLRSVKGEMVEDHGIPSVPFPFEMKEHLK